ncbi:MAG: hypothetical protein U5M51_12540 [Emticicia sp.]|nr:hypothetical protein [Emticicia sp.]
MKALFTILILFFGLISTSQAQIKLSISQKQEDLDFLNKHLRSSHPSYYYHTPKKEMEAYYDSLKTYLAESIDSLSLSKAVRKAVSKVGCGHMSVSGNGKSVGFTFIFFH